MKSVLITFKGGKGHRLGLWLGLYQMHPPMPCDRSTAMWSAASRQVSRAWPERRQPASAAPSVAPKLYTRRPHLWDQTGPSASANTSEGSSPAGPAERPRLVESTDKNRWPR